MLSTSPRLLDASSLVDTRWPSHPAEYFIKVWLVSAISQGGTELEIAHTTDGIVRVSSRRHDGAIIDVLPMDSSTGRTMECRLDDRFHLTTTRIAGLNPELEQEGCFELRLRDRSVNAHVTIAFTPDIDTVTFHLNGIDDGVREQATLILAEWVEHPSRGCWSEAVNPFHLRADEKSGRGIRRCIITAAALLVILLASMILVLWL